MRAYHLLSAIAFIVCLMFITVAYEKGILSGLDARINFGPTHDIWAMTIAISEGFYHSGGGYIGHIEVQDALAKYLAPEGIYAYTDKVESLTRSHSAIEQAIQAAISLNPAELHPYKGYPFVVNWGEDSGQADYYRLAFFLFGYHADSMYKLYFLLFTFSACVFTWRFHRHIWAMVALVALCAAFCALFFSDIFYHVGMQSVNSNRFMASMGFIPILHWMLLYSCYRTASIRPSRMEYVAAGLQALLFAFVLSVRHSAQWQSLLLTLWAVLPLGAALFGAWRKHGPLWPVIYRARFVLTLLLLFMFITGGYNSVRLMKHHPIYFTNCVMPQHFTWHSMYLGLASHPDWPNLAPEGAKGQNGDGIGFLRSEKLYQDENPGKPFICNLSTAVYPARLHEKYMFSEYVKFAFQHPVYMLELHAWYKPRAIYYSLASRFEKVPAAIWQSMMALCGFAFIIGFATRRRISIETQALGALSALLAMSFIPALAAYALYTSDTVWLGMAWLFLMGSALCIWLGNRLQFLITRQI